MSLFIILLAITPAEAVFIKVILVVPVGLILLSLDNGGLGALGSGFNI
jgi:hypothetical protein